MGIAADGVADEPKLVVAVALRTTMPPVNEESDVEDDEEGDDDDDREDRSVDLAVKATTDRRLLGICGTRELC